MPTAAAAAVHRSDGVCVTVPYGNPSAACILLCCLYTSLMPVYLALCWHCADHILRPIWLPRCRPDAALCTPASKGLEPLKDAAKLTSLHLSRNAFITDRALRPLKHVLGNLTHLALNNLGGAGPVCFSLCARLELLLFHPPSLCARLELLLFHPPSLGWVGILAQ